MPSIDKLDRFLEAVGATFEAFGHQLGGREIEPSKYAQELIRELKDLASQKRAGR